MRPVVLAALALLLASAAVAQDKPKCPDTHYPCGGNICCSR
ncbi:hypothetical protein [Salipiger mangrovisoli]|nr:hypothetical protein [Salipiger mangrovisoli]